MEAKKKKEMKQKEPNLFAIHSVARSPLPFIDGIISNAPKIL